MSDHSSPWLPRLPLFVVALIVGAGFWPASHAALPAALMLVWKGAGVALLAIWAGLAARERNGWLLAGVLAFGAAGDVLIDAVGLVAGAAAFLVGHVLAIFLYLSNRRGKSGVIAIGLAIAVLIAAEAFVITRDPAVLPYAIGLGGMAGTAWASRFPRGTVALGALMFVASDLLIFAHLKPAGGSIIPALLIWPLYFAGQALIAYGVVRTLEARKRNEDLHHRL
ncbi:lysoplasmalogenase [Sphingomonas oligophenolica]|uniref:Lysoplasmalogenase n=1 Tax=Sphingomonas oligophenolica TaxID=301154 RepID=A0ABU9Y9C6_9SPHN